MPPSRPDAESFRADSFPYRGQRTILRFYLDGSRVCEAFLMRVSLITLTFAVTKSPIAILYSACSISSAPYEVTFITQPLVTRSTVDCLSQIPRHPLDIVGLHGLQPLNTMRSNSKNTATLLPSIDAKLRGQCRAL